MQKATALLLAAPLLLIGAAYPKFDKPDAPLTRAAPDSAEAQLTWRPCRPGPGDDRCIQLYERGVRGAYAEWRREQGVERAPTRLAMAEPARAAAPARRAAPPRTSQACLDGETAGVHAVHPDEAPALAAPPAQAPLPGGAGREIRGM